MCADIPCIYFSNVLFFVSKHSLSSCIFQSLWMAFKALWGECAPASAVFIWITSTVATNTLLTCTGRYSQLLQLLVQTKPVIAQDVTLTWPKYIFKDKSILQDLVWHHFVPKYNFLKSRRNTTFWTKVGKMGVGEMGIGKTGVGEQVPIKCIVPPAVTMNRKY